MSKKFFIFFFLIFTLCSTAVYAHEIESSKLDKKHFVELEIANSNANTVGLVSAISALLAIIVGPIITLIIANKQLVYPINKKNADKFDEITASYFNLIDTLKKGLDNNLLNESKRQNLLNEINLHYYKIGQMLDPSIPTNSELISEIKKFDSMLNSNKIDHNVFNTFKKNIWTLSRDIAAYKNRLN